MVPVFQIELIYFGLILLLFELIKVRRLLETMSKDKQAKMVKIYGIEA